MAYVAPAVASNVTTARRASADGSSLPATRLKVPTEVPVNTSRVVSRSVPDEVVLITTGPEAGAVQEYQTDALPAPARFAVGAGSHGSADDSVLSPETV